MRNALLLPLAVTVFVALTGGESGPVSPADLALKVASSSESERHRACEAVRQSFRRVTANLLAIVGTPMVDNEPFDSSSPRNDAIRLLGELRAAEAVDELVTWLTPRPEHSGQYFADRPPAHVALVKIGLPAVSALVGVIGEEGISPPFEGEVTSSPQGVVEVEYAEGYLERMSPKGDAALGILREILGEEGAAVALEERLSFQPTAERRANVRTAIERLRGQ
jgi:hypothetical protein